MKVKDAMHKGAAFVAPEAKIIDCALQMKTLDVGALPVKSDGQILGILTDRDIAIRAVAAGRDPAKTTAKDLMSKNTQTCSADDELDRAIQIMKTNQIRRLPVADASGALVGMLSLGDICTASNAQASHTVLQAVAAHH
jgi:CBS domain-containing protein